MIKYKTTRGQMQWTRMRRERGCRNILICRQKVEAAVYLWGKVSLRYLESRQRQIATSEGRRQKIEITSITRACSKDSGTRSKVTDLSRSNPEPLTGLAFLSSALCSKGEQSPEHLVPVRSFCSYLNQTLREKSDLFYLSCVPQNNTTSL